MTVNQALISLLGVSGRDPQCLLHGCLLASCISVRATKLKTGLRPLELTAWMPVGSQQPFDYDKSQLQ